jgi:hypothetical protein
LQKFKITTAKCSLIHPTVRIWPPQTTTCLGPWKITWKVTTTRLTRQSRKSCEAGYEELERTSAAEAWLRFCIAGKNGSGWRFCRRVIKDA